MNGIDALLVLTVLVLGLFAFVLGIFMLVWKVVSGVCRGILGALMPSCRSRSGSPLGRSSRVLVCSNHRCRKIEHRKAAFCGQCGARLG